MPSVSLFSTAIYTIGTPIYDIPMPKKRRFAYQQKHEYTGSSNVANISKDYETNYITNTFLVSNNRAAMLFFYEKKTKKNIVPRAL